MIVLVSGRNTQYEYHVSSSTSHCDVTNNYASLAKPYGLPYMILWAYMNLSTFVELGDFNSVRVFGALVLADRGGHCAVVGVLFGFGGNDLGCDYGDAAVHINDIIDAFGEWGLGVRVDVVLAGLFRRNVATTEFIQMFRGRADMSTILF